MNSRWIVLAALALGCATGNFEDDTDAECLAVSCEDASVESDVSPTPDDTAVDEDVPTLDEPVGVTDVATSDTQEDVAQMETAPPDDVFVARDDGPDIAEPMDAGVDRFSPPDVAVDRAAPVDLVTVVDRSTPADVCSRVVSVSGHAERDCSGGCEVIEEIRGEGSSLEVRSDDRRDRITLSGFTASGRVRSDAPIRNGRGAGSTITLGGSSLSLSGATASGSFDFGANELAAIDGAGATLRFTDTRGNVGVITLTGCP